MWGIREFIDVETDAATLTSATEEERLVQLAINRDRSAFARLYDTHVSAVFKHVYYRLGNYGDAEDVSSEVFLRAWQAIDKYRPRGVPFRAWLFRIANNLIIDRHRTAKERLPLDESTVDGDRSNDPVAVAEMKLARDELRRAIMLLKPDHQQVIALRFIDELDYAEIAAIVAKSEGAVRVIQHRALRELRGVLEGGKVGPNI